MIFSKKQYLLFVAFMTLLIILFQLYIDKTVSLYFIKNAESFKALGKMASVLGESHWYIGAAILGALFYKFAKKNELYAQRFLFLLYANIFSGLASIVLKIFFGRLRPWNLEKDKNAFGYLLFQNPDFSFLQNLHFQFTMLAQKYPYYSSFPSGHTTTSVAVFTYLTLLFPKYSVLWVLLTLLSIFGRVLANDHFVSDLFAGMIVGSIVTLYIYSKMKNRL